MPGPFARLSDPALPALGDLLGAGIPGPVRAIYEMAGTVVDSLDTIQCTWSPGRQLTVRYRIAGSGGELGGVRDLVAMVGSIPEGVGIVEGPHGDVGVWAVPNDPFLPGLASALDRPTVAGLIAGLGSSNMVTRLRLRAYRPGRRAVVQVAAGDSSLFLKVVPPHEAEGLHARHRFLSDFLPVPDSLGVARDIGIVVTAALPGRDLRANLRAGLTLPNPGVIARLLEDLPPSKDDWETRSSIEALPVVVDLLRHLLPGERERLDRLAHSIGDDEAERSVPVHGDFHEAQILVGSERPIGLIDVDTFGWGRPADDPATMLGHLHVLAPECESPSAVIGLAGALNRHWDERMDPVDLRRRTAAVVLGLATGPFRVQRRRWREETRERIALAEQWVGSARRVDEKSLITTSGRSHTAIR